MSIIESNTRCCSKRGPLRQWLIGRKLRRLKLDDTQREQLDGLFATASKLKQGKMTVQEELRDRISQMMVDPAFDRGSTAEWIQATAQRYAESTTQLVTAFGEFYRQLEPWQQQQLRSMWEKRCH